MATDIAEFHKRDGVADHEKYQFINHHYSPDVNYKFRKSSTTGRSFQHQWLVRYPWLNYSKQEDGGYCLPCVMFYTSKNFRAQAGVLVSYALTDFKHAIDSLQKHEQKEYHKEAVVKIETFVKVMSGQHDSVSIQINNAAKELVARNRKTLQSIFETIILCGRQNISLRGHRDAGTDLERACEGHGNFLALLHFRISSGDTLLKEHLTTAPKNATYISPDIQNQVIQVLGDHILHKILINVKEAKYFSVIADEVTDSSNKEQLAVVLRYVNPTDNCIREDLVSFLECSGGISGQALAEMLLDFLAKHDLDPNNLRGQAYDGAGNMAGRVNGTAARIMSSFPLAIYVHCASHCLNLAVVGSLEEVAVRNMIGIVNRVSTFFFAHPKRQRKLEKAIETTQPESSVRKLKDLCRTRWIERIDALQRFQQLLPSVAACMETITSEGLRGWSSDSVTDATTLLLAISTTDFISALVIITACLQHLLGLTRSLQAEAKDIVQAVSEIKSVTATLQDVRNNVEEHHGRWFAEVEELCACMNTEPSLPRLCGRQRHRPNIPAQSPSEYIRRTISIPVLDHLLMEMKTRFDKHQQTAVQGLYLVPSLLVSKTLEEVSPKIQELGDMYKDDLPFHSSLSSEFHCWYMKWRDQEKEHGSASLPTTLYHTLPQSSSMFPNITVLLRILCTLPVTSCTPERSFSGLKRIKTSIRSTMGNERLTSLSLLHCHRDIDINIEEVIDDFARRYPRRLQLANILA